MKAPRLVGPARGAQGQWGSLRAGLWQHLLVGGCVVSQWAVPLLLLTGDMSVPFFLSEDLEWYPLCLLGWPMTGGLRPEWDAPLSEAFVSRSTGQYTSMVHRKPLFLILQIVRLLIRVLTGSEADFHFYSGRKRTTDFENNITKHLKLKCFLVLGITA